MLPAVADALIVTAPAATPETRPLDDTVARDVFALDHVTAAPNTAPFWSRAVAVNWRVCPTVTVCDGPEITMEVSTGAAAVTAMSRVAESDAPPETDACTVMLTDPLATAVTSPPWVIVAMFGALVAQMTVAAIGLPDWSSVVAANWTDCPTCSAAVAGVIETELRIGVGAATETVAVPDTLVGPTVASAVMVAPPTAIAVTSPEPDTAAIVGAVDDHATVAVMAAPFWSRAVAVSCDDWPTVIAMVPETTTLVSTGAPTTVTPNVELTVAVPAVAVAVIVALPAPTALTRPPDVTVATDGDEVDHATAALMVNPDWSRAATVSWSACPTTSEPPAPPAAAMVTVESTGVGVNGPPVDTEPLLPPPPPHAMAPNTTSAITLVLTARGTEVLIVASGIDTQRLTDARDPLAAVYPTITGRVTAR